MPVAGKEGVTERGPLPHSRVWVGLRGGREKGGEDERKEHCQ